MTGDLHTTRYVDCVFDEDHFPTLGGERHPEECREIEWNATGMQSLDPRTSESELEVRRIIHLQSLANGLQVAFTDHNSDKVAYTSSKCVRESSGTSEGYQLC
jgi:hypothetical protein